jgi:RimJ/RimL family protein N-acetyltransferase
VITIDREFKERVVTTFRAMKFAFDKSPDELTVPIYQKGNVVARLRPVHAGFTPQEVKLLMEWRNQNREAFFTWFTATERGTERWLTEQILAREDRILFFIETLDRIPFGHIGLTNFDFVSKACEVDNVLRGRNEFIRGGMSFALQALVNWIFTVLGVNLVYLRVFSDNQRALNFYTRNGFEIVSRVPLRRVEDGDVIRWVETEEAGTVFEKYALYLRMESDKYAGIGMESIT